MSLRYVIYYTMHTSFEAKNVKNGELETNDKVNRSIGKRDELSGHNRQRGDETRQKILEIIIRSEPVGKTSGELVRETGLHRDYIRLICNGMVARGLIVRSGGKFGKYHLAPKTLKGNPRLNAHLFASKVCKEFNRLGNEAICGKSIFCNNNFCKEVFDLADNDENNPELPVDEIYFFEFALRVGAIITYQLLQAIRHSQHNHQQQTASYNYTISNTLKNEYLLKYSKYYDSFTISKYF